MISLNKSKIVKTFEDFTFYDNDYEHSDKIVQYSTIWCEEFPELKKFKLNSDYEKKSWIWKYIYNQDKIEININIIDNNSNWDIYYEMYIIDDITSTEKHFFKKNLTYEELLSALSKICYNIRINKETL